MMDPEAIANGQSSTAVNEMTPAQRLQGKHNVDMAHPVIVGGVEDTKDAVHPPSSKQSESDSLSLPVRVPMGEPISEKAAGKQKESSLSGASPGNKVQVLPAALDTRSEEAFPALKAGPKPQPSNPISMAWGSKKPASVGYAQPNGVDKDGPMAVDNPSRASTPASGILTPDPANLSAAQSRGIPMPRIPLPGRHSEHSERIQFSPSQLLPRDQLKRPLQDLIRAINKRSKATVQLKPGPNKTIFFEATGPPSATRQALIDVAREAGSKQSVKIPIPLSVRPHIIGQRGNVVQRISKETGAHIHIPKSEGVLHPEADEDDSMTIDVVIEGDAVSAESARQAIEAIVNERTSTVTMRLHEIPPEFFPFIAGHHNSGISALESGRQIRISIPHYYTWSREPPLHSSSREAPKFPPDPNNQIIISGDRLAAQEVRSEIEQQVARLHDEIGLSQVGINRGRHQFIAGTKGDLLHNLLQETGCTVVLPPPSNDTEMLFVTGPKDRLKSGVEKIVDLAMVMQMSNVDVARQHPSSTQASQAYARSLTRYFQQRGIISQLEKQNEAFIVLPVTLGGPMNWEVYSKKAMNSVKARTNIVDLIKAYPPERIRYVPVDPFFYQHLEQRSAPLIHEEFGVYLLLPDPDHEASEVVLIYEEPSGGNEAVYQPTNQVPTKNDIIGFQKSLDQAQEHISDLMKHQDDLGAASITVPRKFYEKVQRFLQQEQRHLPPTEIPVQITSASFDGTNGSITNQKTLSSAIALDQEVTIRGPRSAVENFSEKIVAFVESEMRDELERGHVTNFDFPPKYANFLIGRKGENINKYREEFDVEIQVNDGKVEIKGPKAKADLAKTKILALRKKLEDEATHVLKIKPQYHRDMIGAKGNQVNRLQDRYNIRIQFPRTGQNGSDERSVGDEASDAGGSRNGRSNQAPDEVILRGPKQGVDQARDELLNLLQWTIDNSHSSTVSVAQSQVPSLIGQGGREMDNLRMLTGAQIDVPPNRDSTDPSGRVQIQIRGNKKQVEEAKKLLEHKAKAFDETVVKTIHVDKKYHKTLIGSMGSNIRNIVVAAGGSGDRRDVSRTVRFPQQGSAEDSIRIENSEEIVDKIIAAIHASVNQKDSQTTKLIEVAPGKHRLLIGHGGETRRNLESQFNVSIDIPKISQEGPARSQIKIVGQPDDVEQANIRILDIVKDQIGESLQVPRCVHHSISNNGQFFRQLRNEYNVTVDHAGHVPPPKPTRFARPQVNGRASLPLITDDQAGNEDHAWEIIDDNGENVDEGDIPWILRGSPENIAKARVVLDKAVEQARTPQQSSTGYLVLADPRTYRFIVGSGGSQINSIRKQTGCKITVPRDQAKGEAIEIVGSREGVEQAKEIILQVVQNGNHIANGGRKE